MARSVAQQDNDDAEPYLNLFARLAQHLPEYNFDRNVPPFHSSYDNWHVIGHVKKVRPVRSISDERFMSTASLTQRENLSCTSVTSLAGTVDYVVARVTQNGLRIEREYKQAQMLYSADSESVVHFAKPLRLVRMPAQRPGEVVLVVSVIEAPSLAYMEEMGRLKIPFEPGAPTRRRPLPSLSAFLDFAIGTSASLEVLHHRYGLVHGEIRPDAFHFGQSTNSVRMINLGSGIRSFTSRLTSTGWTSLLSEVGIRYKLQYFAPEQTGRLAAEPDMRTDVYALGVGFWAFLTGVMPFKGTDPLEIIQSVLSQHLPSVQSLRPEIPGPVAMVIAKMTKKTMSERYNSITSAKHDLVHIRSLLLAGDIPALDSFQVAQDDISSIFSLPAKLIGREQEVGIMTKTIERSIEHIKASHEVSIFDRSARSSTDEPIVHSSETSRTRSHSLAPLAKKWWPRRRSAQERSSAETLSTTIHQSRSDELDFCNSVPLPDERLTQLISIEGERGIGKTTFMRHMQSVVRRSALLAFAQFEKARTQPLEPVFKLISALFRQVFSEANVDSASHSAIRQQVGPYWKAICAHLELPPWLLDADNTARNLGSSSGSPPRRKSWLDCANISQTSGFMQVLLQVLRVVAFQRLLCFCLDDIDLADAEALNLIQTMYDANLPVILIVMHKPHSPVVPQIAQLVKGATKLELKPFSESETTEYIAETLGNMHEDSRILASIVHDRTGGHPSYVRDFLDRCYTSSIITFSWRSRRWEIQLERVAQCWPQTNDPQKSVETTIFLRFQKLPSEVKNMLSWAAVIGYYISFSALDAVSVIDGDAQGMHVPLPMHDPLESLQYAVSKFIIRPTEDDDIFEFGDENAFSACVMLANEFHVQQMHYLLAKSALQHCTEESGDTRSSRVFGIAEHILNSLDVIRSCDDSTQDYLRPLLKAAESARATGGLRKSAAYCDAALLLVGSNPSSNDHIQLFIQAAEVYRLVDRTEESLRLLAAVEDKISDESMTKVPTIIIRGRIHNAQGSPATAFQTIKDAISKLHSSKIPDSLAECDRILLESGRNRRPSSSTVGKPGIEILFAEAIIMAMFKSPIFPYQYAVALVTQCDGDQHNTYKAIGLLYLSGVSLFRLRARSLAVDLRDEAMVILLQTQNPYDAWSRALILRTLLLGHLENESTDQVDHLTQALESSSTANDRGFVLLSIAAIAMLRLTSSDNLETLEDFIDRSVAEIPDWISDCQNSVLIVCVRQLSRALRGVTRVEDPETILCDGEHDSNAYMEQLQSGNHHFCFGIYQACRVIALNVYGYSKQAMEIGISLMPYIDECRFGTMLNAAFYHTALAIAAVLRIEDDRTDRAQLLRVVDRIRGRIELIARSKTPVCQAWLLIIEAEIGNDTDSLRLLNFAVELVQGQHFVLDEAFCLELYVNCLARMGANGAVVQLVPRCAATYEHGAAIGKANHVLQMISEFSEPESEPSTPLTLSSVDLTSQTKTGVQLPTMPSRPRLRTRADSCLVAERLTSLFNTPTHETPCSDTQSWIDEVPEPVNLVRPEPARVVESRQQAASTGSTQVDIGTLDIIDLHSIISSSQAMTSELQVDRLLQTLTKIIADCTAAEVCSIVIENEVERGGWVMAARQPGEFAPTGLDELEDSVTKQVINYALRFREQIFIHNSKESDLFANIFPSVSSAKQEISIICMPMLHSDILLGSLYCQAPPNTFTDRTMTLVQLLVTQISISLHNAMLFKRLEKASNSNLSMIDLQKDTVKRAQQSERKARYAEVKAIENLKQKEEAMKAKSLFLANVSHELRTPLNGVIGMSTILQDTELTAQQQDCCTNIRISAETLIQIVNDILDYNKLEAGKMLVSNVPMNVHRTLSQVVTTLRATQTKKGVETIVELNIEKDMMILGDSIRLQQVLMNLISNAYKFTPHGVVKVIANVEERKENAIMLKVSVIDSGIGISWEQQKKLFLPFSQADASTARSYGGTGLGLSICKSIVEGVLKGQIWLKSELGEGTEVSFRVGFRLADATALQSPAIVHATTAYAEIDDAARKRKCLHMDPGDIKVCIAEDNVINRKIAMSYLKKLGYKYEAYEDGQQAVDALRKSKNFHVVLMDVQMPVLDGYNATKALRQDSDEQVQNVIIIAMTASTIQGDKERCFRAGMDAYVAKPVRLETLRDAIQSFVAKKR